MKVGKVVGAIWATPLMATSLPLPLAVIPAGSFNSTFPALIVLPKYASSASDSQAGTAIAKTHTTIAKTATAASSFVLLVFAFIFIGT